MSFNSNCERALKYMLFIYPYPQLVLLEIIFLKKILVSLVS